MGLKWIFSIQVYDSHDTMDTYTILGNTLLLGDDVNTLSDDEVQRIFNHFTNVVMNNQQNEPKRVLVRESPQVFTLEKQKPKKTVSFGACHVRYIPKENLGYKVPTR